MMMTAESAWGGQGRLKKIDGCSRVPLYKSVNASEKDSAQQQQEEGGGVYQIDFAES